jgi:predicted MPP superfamily phosphohydrolase
MNTPKLLLYSLLLILVGIAACTSEDMPPAPNFAHAISGEATPWTHDDFDNADGKFAFAIFSDLYSGERDRVFSIAMAQLNLLRPELILSIGDLIDGGTEDRDRLAKEWDEFDAKVAAARAPAFYVGGNHDLTNLTMRDVWTERYGARYYHFVYKNVLFLMLDSEDFEDWRMQMIYKARAIAIEILEGDEPEKWPETAYFKMPERNTGMIRAEQAAYFRRVIAENPQVRWTFLLMHKPVWRNEDAKEFQSIEVALADRPYTVINGHFHSYSLTQRNGRDYIHLGTTSGDQNAADDMAFDHVTLVTVDEGEPSIVNLRMDGILDKSGQRLGIILGLAQLAVIVRNDFPVFFRDLIGCVRPDTDRILVCHSR